MNSSLQKSTSRIIRFILFSSVLVLLFSCSTQSNFGYGYTTNQFTPLGWVKVNDDNIDSNRVYKRINFEQKHTSVMMLIIDHGFPDYYKVVAFGEVYYGYASTGNIYHFTNYFKNVEKFNYSTLGDSIPVFMFNAFNKNFPSK